MISRVQQNHEYLQALINSLQCGITKAKNGSPAEDEYVTEKIKKFAYAIGLKIEGVYYGIGSKIT